MCEFDGHAAGHNRSTFREVSARFFRFCSPEANLHGSSGWGSARSRCPGYRIEDIQGKAAFTRAAPAAARRPRCRRAGRRWPFPATDRGSHRARWTATAGSRGTCRRASGPLLRLGHTTTGKDNHPAPGPASAWSATSSARKRPRPHFAGLMGKLIADNEPAGGPRRSSPRTSTVGKSARRTGRRGCAKSSAGAAATICCRCCRCITGRVVDSLEVSERFLWDLRQTVSDLLVENYAGHIARAGPPARAAALDRSLRRCPATTWPTPARPTSRWREFWSWAKFGAAYSCTEMSSAAHVYGKRILGAEAFTATDARKVAGPSGQHQGPGRLGLLRGHQPLRLPPLRPAALAERRPGMSMGPWGLHYERTQTWWEQSRRLARVSGPLPVPAPAGAVRGRHLLPPAGRRAATRFAPAEPSVQPATPHGSRPGYNFDGCPPEVVLTRMTVKDGRLVLPDGMSYRVLVLPAVETMTPALLGKIKELVEAGATVVRPSRPEKSPSLVDYPRVRRRGAEAGRGVVGRQTRGDGQDGRGSGWPARACRRTSQAGPAAALHPSPLPEAGRLFRRQRQPAGRRDGVLVPRRRQAAGTWHPETGRDRAAAGLRRETGLHARAPPVRARRGRCSSSSAGGGAAKAQWFGHARRAGIAGPGLARAATRRRSARLDPLRQEVSQPGAYVVRTVGGQRRFHIGARPAAGRRPLGRAIPRRLGPPRADHAPAVDLVDRAGADAGVHISRARRPTARRWTCRRRCLAAAAAGIWTWAGSR